MYCSFNIYQYLLASSHVSVPDIFYSVSGLFGKIKKCCVCCIVLFILCTVKLEYNSEKRNCADVEGPV